MQQSLKEFQREVTTLYKVRHPNLVLFVGACADKGHIMILTEFCSGGSLFSLLHEKRSINLSLKQKHRMALDIAKGMNYLHTQDPPILHRDLKSLNLLVYEQVRNNSDFIQIKITDFGLSRHNDDLSTSRMTGLAGTFHWMAPEVLKSDEYTHKADVYSYGIVLWEVIMREPPFS
jgi:serine/threonine protein kinase